MIYKITIILKWFVEGSKLMTIEKYINQFNFCAIGNLPKIMNKFFCLKRIEVYFKEKKHDLTYLKNRKAFFKATFTNAENKT